MRRRRLGAFVAFAAGAATGVLGAARFDTSIFLGKAPAEASSALLERAVQQAGKGSWENLAVARVYYLSGDRAKGQELIDRVASGKMAEEDWMRVGRIYLEAGDWDKAREAFAKALDKDPKDAENLAEVGAQYNLHGDREKAEELFVRAFERKPDELWVTVDVAASYRGVTPQP